MSSGGAGSVYYFNATPNAMLLLNNNHLLNANVAGIAKSGGYKAAGSSVLRDSADHTNNKTFGTDNTLVVSFPDGGSQEYPVHIDPNSVQITNDVQLYIYFNQVVLVTPTGSGQGSQLVIDGTPASERAHEAIRKAKEEAEDAA
jgi:hypothetical protein